MPIAKDGRITQIFNHLNAEKQQQLLNYAQALIRIEDVLKQDEF